MARLLLLSAGTPAPGAVLETLDFLEHEVAVAEPSASALVQHPQAQLVLVDARRDLADAKRLCGLLHTAAPQVPLLAVLTEGGLAAVSTEWGIDDLVVVGSGPAELAARIRLALGRPGAGDSAEPDDGQFRASGVVVDANGYTAKIHGQPMNLTFKEFELLKHLVQHPGRVFSREQLLHEVWGYDYFGGTRTVDVHVRRLRAKLGPDQEQLIGTVRNVGYRFAPRESGTRAEPTGPIAPSSASPRHRSTQA